MENETFFIVYLSRGHVALVACFFTTFVECSFQLCNNWLCTSSDVEAGFNYPLYKKSVRACCERLRCNMYFFKKKSNYECKFEKKATDATAV
jgi:hypothetical protein